MPTTTSSPFDSPLPSPHAALDTLQTARETFLNYQTQVEARLKSAQEEVLKEQAQTQAARAQLLQAQSEAARLKEICALEEAKRQGIEAAHAETKAHRDQIAVAHQEVQARHAEEKAAHAQTKSAHDEACARCEAEMAAHEGTKTQAQKLKAWLDEQKNHNKKLHSELLEVYRDLRAEDLPTLILRVGMSLVGAENGLFVDDSGEKTLAAVGMDDLPEEITQSLYRFTRKALETEEPVICNNSEELPDHDALVNLAALPVSMQNDLKGVILVANKRDGDFDEDDSELLLAIGRHAGIAMENQRLHCALGDAFISTVAVLADAVEAKDPYTRGHCEGVSDLAAHVAERMDWDKAELDQIRYAALLHDVGKLGVPDSILLKPSGLLPEEFRLIQTHVTIGRDLVSRVSSLEPIAPIVYHHHEHWNGGGYPDGLSGTDIPLGARIVGAVDALDAMTTKRPYREPMSMQDASIEMRRCAGTQFDPSVVEHLMQVLEDRAPMALSG